MKLRGYEQAYFERYINHLLSTYKIIYQMNRYIQHGDTTTYDHVLAVARYSYLLSCRLPFRFDTRSLILGAILHDFYLYDWHDDDKSHRLHGFYHPGKALVNADKYFQLNNIERDIISKHMFPLTITKVPRYRESVIVCIADKIVATKETFSRMKTR